MQTQQNRIRELRDQKGWSMADLAKRVGTTTATIDRLEKSRIKLTVAWMTRLAEPLGVRPGDLAIWGTVSGPNQNGLLHQVIALLVEIRDQLKRIAAK